MAHSPDSAGSQSPGVADLLAELRGGREGAWDDLVPVLYQELREIARRHLGRERPDHTLQTTALVHEAYLKLASGGDPVWNDRALFFAVASRAMRQILTDYARSRSRTKRGGGMRPVSLDRITPERATPDALGPDLLTPIMEERDTMFLALDEALTRLEQADPRQCRVVECRFYSGLSIADTAEALGVSVNTVKRDWASARAWLNQELGDGA
jgi:RNA polymerase sigma factor (TIGR02999 family)